jgi:CRP/FNR family cyclic AMP-dependent transcriptional regulator
MAVSDIALRNCSLFQQVPPAFVVLAAQQMTILELKKREILLVNGSPFRGLGVVLHGRMQAMDYTVDGREVALTTVEQSEAFGQANLLASRPVDLTWVAVNGCTVAVMPQQAALDLFKNTDMSWRVAADLAQQVCEFLSWQKILSVHPISARVCAWLCWASAGKADVLVPRHAELAWRLSTTRESITRTLQKLQTEKVLRRNGDDWMIENQPVLEKMALGENRGVE